MAEQGTGKNFPGPSYNRLIEKDAQIIKVDMDTMGWGARKSIFNELGNDPTSQNPANPTAPEMTLRHVKGS